MQCITCRRYYNPIQARDLCGIQLQAHVQDRSHKCARSENVRVKDLHTGNVPKKTQQKTENAGMQ